MLVIFWLEFQSDIVITLSVCCLFAVPRVICHVTLNDFIARMSWNNLSSSLIGPTTGLNNVTSTVIGPMTGLFSLIGSWIRHSGSPDWPALEVGFSSGTVPLHIRQDHLLTVRLICDSINVSSCFNCKHN